MYAKKQIILTVLALAVFFLGGWKTAEYYYFNNLLSSENITTIERGDIIEIKNGNPQDVNLSLYWNVWERLETNYLNESAVQNDQNLIYGSIKGLVNALDDPYTVFMTPKETKQFEENLQGSLQGIGAELSVEDGMLIVVSPLKDSPAEKAGLRPGDVIFQIDGDATGEMTLFEAIMNIRGEKGTDVTLTIIREDIDEPFDVTITRDEITIESVTTELLDGNISYVSVNQFSDNTTKEFDEAIQEILIKNPKGVILDLRYNGGGYLDIAVEILSEFISGDKTAVIIQRRNPDDNQTLQVLGNTRLPDIPLVVLVNRGSASASEIVAGAIQDHKRGLVMGEETFGKGSVQEVELLRDGSSLRLTIAKWLTPEGRDIEEAGIVPDRIIELTQEDIENEFDSQLEEARTYLMNL
jgi:carboxyl-terminal processing protease